MASQPLLPRERDVRPLRPRQADLDALVSHELHAGTSVCSPAPISPEERLTPNHRGMEEDAHLAWFHSGAAIPWTLLAQGTGAATVNAGSIRHAEAAIDFSALLMSPKRLPCWTTQRPVGRERNVGSGEAPRFQRGGGGRWAVSRGRSG